MRFPNKKKIHRLLAVTSSTLVLLLSAASSQGWPGPGIPGGPGPGPLPFGHAIVHVGHLAFFFLDGLFYRPGPKGYVVVSAPTGALVETLPPSAALVVIDGSPYYSCSGAYYKKTADGYLVVAQPVADAPQEIGIGQQLRVNVDILNVRSGPGLHHPVVQQLHQDTVLQVEGVSGEWCLITTDGRQSGWIQSRYAIILDSGGKG